jgi:hypothetical protein
LVTVIGPVVAPAGTVVTICVAEDDRTEAATPLKVTMFSFGTVENAVPEIVTEVPIVPVVGLTAIMETVEELCREIDTRLPAAS